MDANTNLMIIYAFIAFVATAGGVYITFFDKDEEDLETA